MLRPTNRHGWLLTLALGLLLPVFRELRAAWLVRVSHRVAQYSYGIYLSHPLALCVGMYLLRRRPLWLQLTTELAIIVVSSILAYHLLEEPMIRFGAKLAARVEASYERRRAAARGPLKVLVQ